MYAIREREGDREGEYQGAREKRTWWLRAGVAVAVAVVRVRSVDFASHRQRLALGLSHGLVLAPGAQGGLCGGALTGESLRA